MKVLYIIFIVLGSFLVCWGFWRANRGPEKGQSLAAFLSLVGVFVTFLGLLLFFVPGFFTLE